MQITLIGHGRMGKLVQDLAETRHHKITNTIKNTLSLDTLEPNQDTCIDFTNPDAFRKNYKIIAAKFQRAIIGTTGWNDIEKDVCAHFAAQNKTLIFASNFSLGVNVFAHIVATTARLLAALGSYDNFILEMHHHKKKDAPSGTALMLDKIMKNNFGKSANPVAIRCGNIKGIHEAGFESEVDKIILKHEAYSRHGFAEGALLAAEIAATVKGVWDFKDLLADRFKEILQN